LALSRNGLDERGLLCCNDTRADWVLEQLLAAGK
jgi:hypothetical protein